MIGRWREADHHVREVEGGTTLDKKSESSAPSCAIPRASHREHALVVGLLAVALGLGACDEKIGHGRDAGADAAVVDGGTDGGSDGGPDAGPDAGPDGGPDSGTLTPCAGLPGLYAPGSCSVLAAGVMPYASRYELWSDGAEKSRFVLLPSGTTIDAADPDAWIYPVGTTLWKHFSVGGTRVETRMLRKVSAGVGSGAWEMRTFQWNEAQDDVTEVINGATNVLGTAHDIPAVALCAECHRTKDVVNGFSAIQLNHAGAGVPLTFLISTNRLANLPVGFVAADANIPGTPTEVAALGYLHANCGHCHLGVGGVVERANQRFWVPVGLDLVTETPAYSNMGWGSVGVPTIGWMTGGAIQRVAPGSVATSAVHLRMNTRVSINQMPPLATEQIDVDGLATITAWINALP